MLSRIRNLRTHGALFGLALEVAALHAVGCGANSAGPDPLGPITPDTVYIVDQAGFNDARNTGRYDISAVLGTVRAAAACESGNVDEKCIEAAREQLRAAAKERGANLVRVSGTAVLQTFPPQYAITGDLYRVSNR
jgi:hypothetical protein